MKLNSPEITKVFNKFGKEVVTQARGNLTRRKINVSKDLYNSLDYQYEGFTNSFRLTFSMADYGQFIDQGVKGSKDSRKAPRSQFKYTNKMPPSKDIDRWVVRKGLDGTRNKKGQFVSRQSLTYAIRRSIFLYGIKATHFFEDAFVLKFKRFDDVLETALGLAVDNLLDFTRRN